VGIVCLTLRRVLACVAVASVLVQAVLGLAHGNDPVRLTFAVLLSATLLLVPALLLHAALPGVAASVAACLIVVAALDAEDAAAALPGLAILFVAALRDLDRPGNPVVRVGASAKYPGGVPLQLNTSARAIVAAAAVSNLPPRASASPACSSSCGALRPTRRRRRGSSGLGAR
jgi:hypothetical protein